MRAKILLSITLILCFLCCLCFPTLAHSGDTDSKGGHVNQDTGKYHYHCGGNPAHQHRNGICPYSNVGNPNSNYVGNSNNQSNSNNNSNKSGVSASENYTNNDDDGSIFGIIIVILILVVLFVIFLVKLYEENKRDALQRLMKKPRR